MVNSSDLKILLLGSTGQVGWELHRSLITIGDLTALDFPDIDMADPRSIVRVVRAVKPHIIINATAFTDVDRSEVENSLALAINAKGPGVLAQESKNLGAALIHYSTDYVFDGTRREPYTEADSPNPINFYGRTKLAGEKAVMDVSANYLIFRTSWVYSNRRPCFVSKVLAWSRQKKELRIVNDQVSSPTSARTLAEVTAQIIARGREDPLSWLAANSGLYHLVSRGSCSRLEWARQILADDPRKQEQVLENLEPASSSDFPTPAERPLYTVLDCEKLVSRFGVCLPGWEVALKLALE